MVGDQNDIQNRIRAVIPYSWFKEPTPLIDAVISGLARMLAGTYALIQYAKAQTRLATATDGFLDIAAYDYLGFEIQRKTGEADATFSARIRKEILRQRVTRPGMVQALTDLTGVAPVIFEPWNPNDTGGYGTPTMGYGVRGRYGSLQLPAQVFISVTQSSPVGVPGVGGYGSNISAYGGGNYQYVGAADAAIGITAADIYETIERTKPTGVIAWVAINPPAVGPPPFIASVITGQPLDLGSVGDPAQFFDDGGSTTPGVTFAVDLGSAP